MDKKIRYNPNCAMCQGKGFYTVGNTFGTQSTAHSCNCHVFYDIKENSQDLDTDIVDMVNEEFWNLISNDMKTAEGNFANTLLGEGYSSCEVCFNIKLKRRGFMKWLEDKKLIKPKTEGFALMVRDWDRVDILSSNEESVVIITSTKVNGLR